MSDTPRTDKAAWRENSAPASECVTAEFARELERELGAQKVRFDTMSDALLPRPGERIKAQVGAYVVSKLTSSGHLPPITTEQRIERLRQFTTGERGPYDGIGGDLVAMLAEIERLRAKEAS